MFEDYSNIRKIQSSQVTTIKVREMKVNGIIKWGKQNFEESDFNGH